MKKTDEENRRWAQQLMARDRLAGHVVELGFGQQRLLAFAVGAVGAGALSVASGRGVSVYTVVALLCSLGWHNQAARFAKQRATLYNAGTIAWRRQNVFIYWWCNTHLPAAVSIATQIWWMQGAFAGLIAGMQS